MEEISDDNGSKVVVTRDTMCQRQCARLRHSHSYCHLNRIGIHLAAIKNKNRESISGDVIWW